MYKLSTQFWKCLFKRNLSQWANNKVLHFVTYQSRRSVSYKSSMFNLQNASRAEVKEFLGTFDTVLTDCDGKSEIKSTNNSIILSIYMIT